DFLPVDAAARGNRDAFMTHTKHRNIPARRLVSITEPERRLADDGNQIAGRNRASQASAPRSRRDVQKIRGREGRRREAEARTSDLPRADGPFRARGADFLS